VIHNVPQAEKGLQRALPPAGEGPAADLERAITVIMRWSNSREVQAETLRRARTELSAGTLSLLSRIAVCGPVHPSELAILCGVDNSTMTPKLQRLERAGVIARDPDPSDGRGSLVRITAVGERLRKRLHATRRVMLEELLQPWPQSEVERVAEAMTWLAERLELPPQGSASVPPSSSAERTA
jgi:DNA-binding MarR family transcriptional regulator